MGASAATPAAEHLIQVRTNSEAELLSEMKAQEFHHITAQLLFLYGRARRDIQVSVAFLTTRVKKPDTDDWGKLQRVLNSFPSMASYMKSISNLYFAGENHCVLTFARLFYKCKDEYCIY